VECWKYAVRVYVLKCATNKITHAELEVKFCSDDKAFSNT